MKQAIQKGLLFNLFRPIQTSTKHWSGTMSFRNLKDLNNGKINAIQKTLSDWHSYHKQLLFQACHTKYK